MTTKRDQIDQLCREIYTKASNIEYYSGFTNTAGWAKEIMSMSVKILKLNRTKSCEKPKTKR